jgi:pimeloyl-ACP methyl ester carboxylesterase
MNRAFFAFLAFLSLVSASLPSRSAAGAPIGPIGEVRNRCLDWYPPTDPQKLVNRFAEKPVRSPLRSRYRDLNGTCLHWVEGGDPQAERAILLIHGYPEFWYGWHKLIDPLVQAGYFVIMPDVRGVNESGRPRGVSHYLQDVYARDMATLVASLGRPRVDVIAYDTGGMTGWYLAASYPDLVRKLMVANFPHPEIYRRNLILSSRRERGHRHFARSFFVYGQAYQPDLAASFFLQKGIFSPFRLSHPFASDRDVLVERLDFEMRTGPETGVLDRRSILPAEVELYADVLLKGPSRNENSVRDWFRMFEGWAAPGQVLDTDEDRNKLFVCATIQRESTMGMWRDRLSARALAGFARGWPKGYCRDIPDGVRHDGFRLPRIGVPVRMFWGERDGYLDTELSTRVEDYLPLLASPEPFRILRYSSLSHWSPEQGAAELLRQSLSFFAQEGGAQ